MYAAISDEPTAYAARPVAECRNGIHTTKTTKSSRTRLAGTPPGSWPVNASPSDALTSPPGTGRNASAAP